MNTTQLFVFRHGETDWNTQHRFQGHTDIPLNAKGREQARQLAQALKACELEVILSSDLVRALETARIAAELSGVPVLKSEALREARLGEPEGMYRHDIIQKYGAENWERWRSTKKADLDFAYPLGETKRAQLSRVQNYIESFLQAQPYGRIGISTHGASARRLVHMAIDDDQVEPVPMGNCALYRLEYDRTAKHWRYLGPVSGII